MASFSSAFVTGASGFVGGALTRRLVGEGVDVRALARSDASAAKVEELGAEPVRGDLGDADAIRAGAQAHDIAFHAAATVSEWGPGEEFERVNVEGTRTMLGACAGAGVGRFVHVGTEAALLAGQPLHEVDETAPLRPDSPAIYSSTKAKAEALVRGASRDGFETVVLRPRFVWGRGDTSLLPAMVEMVRAGRFAWVGGGRHLTATTHIDNTVEGLVLAAERGHPGGAYFVTDGGSVVFRDFVTQLLATQGVEAPSRNVPTPVARAGAAVSEAVWRALRFGGSPPLTRFAVWVSSQECTIDISLAGQELGYSPVITRERGLAELRDASPETT
jgi:nucleoside-diphosphate-sugar epimerase